MNCEMTSEQRPAPQYSALQLAWLQELGIEKPWLPAHQRKSLVAATVTAEPNKNPAAQPTVTVRPKRQSGTVQARTNKVSVPAPSPAIQVDTEAAAAEAVDLTALAAIVSTCQACGLCRERQQAVFGEGVMQPALMVIGEAPADQEDRQGRPFVDRMGLMLDNMLTAIQSSRTHNVYLSNIVKCRPPGNRNPKPEELAACKPYLLRQIALVQPFAILAVGKVAAQVLLDTEEPLDKLRQITHTLRVGDLKIPLIVSHHPANLLNHPAHKALAWQDLQLVKTVSGS